MFKSRKALIIRFLKIHKLYRNNKALYKVYGKLDDNSYYYNNDLNINFLDNNIGWRGTREGHSFWLRKQCDFIRFVIKYDKEFTLFEKNKVKDYFFKLFNGGYFGKTSIEKDSLFYNDFKNEYDNFINLNK